MVASPVAGIPDVVKDRLHGRLVAAKDPQQIVTAIREMAESPENLQWMSRQCRTRAVDEYGLERLAERFGALYQQLLA